MRFSIVTLFPEFFDSSLKTSILGRALESKALEVDFVPLRDFGEGKYRAVDDKPFGGGVGMVMLPTVLEKALGSEGLSLDLDALEKDVKAHEVGKPYVVALTPQGRKLTAAKARALAQEKHVVVLCGHYEGFDERSLEAFAHEEISIGDYVLTGGEPAAVVLLDAVARFIPGVVGKSESVSEDTFGEGDAGLKYAQYTRPQSWRGRDVPEVLMSGHHARVREWREQDSAARTRSRRPDLQTGAHKAEALEHPTYIALLHHPMLNRQGDEVCTAVTNMDLHDISRSARTYGILKYFVVNPEPEQERVVGRILAHWKAEISKVYHPARAQALAGVEFLKTLDEACEKIAADHGGKKPFVVMPDARDLRERFPESIPAQWANPTWTYEDLKEKLQRGEITEERPLLILFGTGWGPAPSLFKHVDQPLAPLRSNQKYNHLSVRSAVAIVLDRLFGLS